LLFWYYIIYMGTITHGILEYDEEKNRRNIEERGLSFELAKRVIADPNLKWRVDDRHDYGETRYIGYGYADGKRLRLCWTFRGGYIRVISLFRVHKKEWEEYYGKDN